MGCSSGVESLLTLCRKPWVQSSVLPERKNEHSAMYFEMEVCWYLDLLFPACCTHHRPIFIIFYLLCVCMYVCVHITCKHVCIHTCIHVTWRLEDNFQSLSFTMWVLGMEFRLSGVTADALTHSHLDPTSLTSDWVLLSLGQLRGLG